MVLSYSFQDRRVILHARRLDVVVVIFAGYKVALQRVKWFIARL